MFTDMVGYTALTQSNESLAMQLLERHNRLLRPFFPKFNGREVKAIGDSFLVEFDSSLDALRCAFEIQSFFHDYNISSRDEWRIHLRIGIHLGDVIHQGSDIFGDAVNIASRIEPIAEPEGICVSRQVYDQVSNKFDLPMTSLGEKSLKNVAVPAEVYKVLMPWSHQPVTGSQILAIRRVAVLPFASLSPDPNDEYFADGLTEELIDRLCKVKELEVIARTSVMTFKKKDVKAADIGKELRAGALVEGSVRKAGNKIRVTAQLINANTEGHLWSSKYDRNLDDIFAVQTDIAEQVAGALEVQLLPAEKSAIEKKQTQSMEAYTLYLKGRQLWNRRTKNGVDEAMKCFERASQVDPNFALAYVGIADCYAVMENFGTIPAAELAPKIKESALRALKLDSGLAEAHTTYAMALATYEWRWEEAELEFKRAIELNPNYATAHHWYAYTVLRTTRRMDEDIREANRALELDPLAPIMTINKGQTLFIQERYDEALECCNIALKMDPEFFPAQTALAYTLVSMGKFDEGTAMYEKYMPHWTILENEKKLLWAWVYARSGRETDARRLLADVVARNDRSIHPTSFAIVYGALGETERMFESLELAFLEREPGLCWTIVEPQMKKFQSDPRLRQIKQKMGIKSL